MPLDDEQKLNIEISENEARKDFSKSERMEYALRLAKIESVKARERSLSNLKQNETDRQKSDERRVDDTVSEKLGIGSRDTYRKEKYIYENQSSLTPEDLWDKEWQCR